MRKFKVLNARAKSQIGRIIELDNNVLETADKRNSGGDLIHLSNYEVTNPLTFKVFGRFEMYQYEGDGNEWHIKFSTTGAGSTWYIVEEITEEPAVKTSGMRALKPVSTEAIISQSSKAVEKIRELAPANPCGTIADKILDDCADANAKIFERLESESRLNYRASEHFKRKAQGIAVLYGSEVYTDKPVPLRVGFEHNDKGIRELRKSVKACDRSAFGKVVYRSSDYTVLKEDTIGEPLGQVGKYYFIGGLRYIVRDWYYEFITGVLTFRLQLSHIL